MQAKAPAGGTAAASRRALHAAPDDARSARPGRYAVHRVGSGRECTATLRRAAEWTGSQGCVASAMPRLGPFGRHHRAIGTVLAGVLGLLASLAAGPRMSPVDGFLYDLSLSLTARRQGILARTRSRHRPRPRPAWPRPELAATPPCGASSARFCGPKLVGGLAAKRRLWRGRSRLRYRLWPIRPGSVFPALRGQYDPRIYLARAAARARSRRVAGTPRTAQETPAIPFFGAVFNPPTDAGKPEPQAIASIEMFPDADGVQRRVASSVATQDGQARATLPAALLARAGGPAMPPQVLLAPALPLEAIPTYRLIDVLRCLDSGSLSREPGVRRSRIVLVGARIWPMRIASGHPIA